MNEPIFMSGDQPGAFEERRLWQAVILQAIRDALLNRPKMGGAEALAKHQALNWLAGGTDDFNQVCQNAGFEPDTVSGWWRGIAINLDKISSIKADLLKTIEDQGIGRTRRGRRAAIAAE